LAAKFSSLVLGEQYGEIRNIVQRMVREDPDSVWTAAVSNLVGGPDLLTLPGKPLPSWEARDFDDHRKVHTHATIAAKARIYLLGFWASW